jgi:hypothetical protein
MAALKSVFLTQHVGMYMIYLGTQILIPRRNEQILNIMVTCYLIPQLRAIV